MQIRRLRHIVDRHGDRAAAFQSCDFNVLQAAIAVTGPCHVVSRVGCGIDCPIYICNRDYPFIREHNVLTLFAQHFHQGVRALGQILKALQTKRTVAAVGYTKIAACVGLCVPCTIGLRIVNLEAIAFNVSGGRCFLAGHIADGSQFEGKVCSCRVRLQCHSCDCLRAITRPARNRLVRVNADRWCFAAGAVAIRGQRHRCFDSCFETNYSHTIRLFEICNPIGQFDTTVAPITLPFCRKHIAVSVGGAVVFQLVHISSLRTTCVCGYHIVVRQLINDSVIGCANRSPSAAEGVSEGSAAG